MSSFRKTYVEAGGQEAWKIAVAIELKELQVGDHVSIIY